jgi:ADP-heptose:LPS heptosyltransferase
MGDVILATPLFSYLKSRYHDASITFVTGPAYCELFNDDLRLSSVKTFAGGKTDESIINGQWDLVIDLQNNVRSRQLIGSLTHVREKGHFNKLHSKRFALLFMRINRYPERNYVSERYIQASGPAKSDMELPSPYLSFNIDTRPDLKVFLDCGNMVRPTFAMLPFSKWKNKQWPIAYFAKVGRFFHTKGWNILVMGGKEDAPEAEKLAAQVGQRCRSLAGKLSLYECGCVFSRCSLALGIDTGLSHLARSCGVKTGIIYGPTTHHFGFYPYGKPPFAVFEHSWFCRPCHPHGGNLCFLNRQCLRLNRPDTVIRGLQQLVFGQHENASSGFDGHYKTAS